MTATTTILGDAWFGRIAVPGETGLPSYPCPGMTQVGLQFKDTCPNISTNENLSVRIADQQVGYEPQ